MAKIIKLRLANFFRDRFSGRRNCVFAIKRGARAQLTSTVPPRFLFTNDAATVNQPSGKIPPVFSFDIYSGAPVNARRAHTLSNYRTVCQR